MKRKNCTDSTCKYRTSEAEKDLELTWEKIYSILYFEREVLREFGNEEHSNEEICKEVLKRFKAQRTLQYDIQKI